MDAGPSPPLPERLFPPLAPDTARAMESLLEAVEEARPLPAKRRRGLQYDVRELWAALTTERESRKAAYLSSPAALSAYLRFYMPWNVYRYARLFSALDFSFLRPGSVIVDIGSGPLSAALALFLALPETRKLPLTLYAVDRAPQGMEAGADVLSALSLRLDGKLPAWKIVRVHGDAEAPIKEKADLLLSGYFLNEFAPHGASSPAQRAARMARIAGQRLKEDGRVLVLEAGDARSASLVSALREALIESGMAPIAPCPHAEPCPMPGFYRARRSPGEDGKELLRDSRGRPLVLASGKRPWCHFTFAVDGAPPRLLKLSREAGLPKDCASLSFFLAMRGSPSPAPADTEPVRIVSEAFSLPESRLGRYACGRQGYLLLRGSPASALDRALPGDLIRVRPEPNPGRDPKTRALLIDLDNRAKAAKSPHT